MQLEVSNDYGYVIALGCFMYLTQQLILLIVPGGVMSARKDTGIKAPTLYPRDSEIKKLKLTDEQVNRYYCAQRAHQNSMEFYSVFMGLFLIIGLFEPLETAKAGAVVAVFRLIGGFAYIKLIPVPRGAGGFFHLGELYVLYLGFRQAYRMTQ
jgi:uncharacterized MAPEG superfamily protein